MKALETTDLAPTKFPTSGKLIKESEKREKTKEEREEKKEKRKTSRQSYFCIAMGDFWKGRNAIHITINQLKKKY